MDFFGYEVRGLHEVYKKWIDKKKKTEKAVIFGIEHEEWKEKLRKLKHKTYREGLVEPDFEDFSDTEKGERAYYSKLLKYSGALIKSLHKQLGNL